MKFELKSPCNQCPFLKDSPIKLVEGRCIEIWRSITDHDATFPCHKTIDYDKLEGEHGTHSVSFRGTVADYGERAQHCAGAMIVLERMSRPNQIMRIAERTGMYDHKGLDMDAPVVESLDEFRAQSLERLSLGEAVERLKP